MTEYLNIWVKGVPMCAIELKTDSQRKVMETVQCGDMGADVFIARQNAPLELVKPKKELK